MAQTPSIMPCTAAVRRLEFYQKRIFDSHGIDALLFHRFPLQPSHQTSCTMQTIKNETQLEDHLVRLKAKLSVDTVLVLLQNHSWDRLHITYTAFDVLARAMNVSPSLYEVVTTFGAKMDDGERSFHGYRTCARSALCSRDQHDISYTIPYMYRHDREPKAPWSMRRLGIYHQTRADDRTSHWIIIDLASHAEVDLRDFIQSKPDRSKARLHAELLIHSSGTWCDYVEYLVTATREFDHKACYSSVDHAPETKYHVTHSDLQALHMLEAKIQRAHTAVDVCCEVARGIEKHITTHSWLDSFSDDDIEAVSILDAYHADMKRYSSILQKLILRLNSTTNLISNVLSCRSGQLLQISNTASNEMLEALVHITNQSRQQQETLATILGQDRLNSAMLKALSVVATVCLPPSLVATIFSSNLVQTRDSTDPTPESHLVLSSQFWLYIVISLPMMAITLAWIMCLNRKRREPDSKS